jgi:LacI family transcriptional regulator
MAAELLGKFIRTEATVAIITGQLSTFDHGEKLRGFAGMLATVAPHLRLLPAVETHERAEDAYQATLALLRRTPPPAGLYVSTANSLSVLRAVEEMGLLGKIEIITTDLFPELVPYLEAGHVSATIYQRAFTQGRVAMDTLVRYLAEGVRPEPCQRLAPHIILRSNLHLFLP